MTTKSKPNLSAKSKHARMTRKAHAAVAKTPTSKSARAERTKTGIHGYDALVEGGFVKNSVNLVSGGCGAGKTLFGAQFLYNGATKYNEPGVLVSLEQKPEEIRKDMANLGIDPEPLEKAGKLSIVYCNPLRFVDKKQVVEDSVERILEEHVKQTGAKRVVLDSLCAFELYLQHKHEIRQKVYQITNVLKSLGVTAIVTSEIPEQSQWYSRFGVEEFVCDSVTILNYMEFQGGTFRSCFIRKMRRTHQTDDIMPFEIQRGKGIVIKPAHERFQKYVLAKSRGKV